VADEALEVLVFEVAGRHYGLPARSVREVVRAVTVVPLPRAPAIVEGVVNLRGRLVPVLDLRARFRLPAKAVEPTDHLVVAWAGSRPAALRVDRAIDLVTLAREALEQAEQVVPGAGYVAWVAKLLDRLVLIHDLDTFLSAAEAAGLDEALPAGGEEARAP
jgi:purine-binding chemotaxis protein CheW